MKTTKKFLSFISENFLIKDQMNSCVGVISVYLDIASLRKKLRNCFPNDNFYFVLTGIFNSAVATFILGKSFTSKITSEMNTTWYKKRGESVHESLRRFLLVYLGEPLTRLIA